MSSLALLIAFTAPLDTPPGELIFEDKFERSETDDAEEQVGNGWKTNSKSRAKGNKQVDLVDGHVHVTRHEVADHGVSFVHDLGFRDGSVTLRVKLRAGDDFGINFADLTDKTIHAGHLFMVKFKPRRTELEDLRSARMRLDVRERRLAGDKSPELKKLIGDHTKVLKLTLEPGEWHDVRVDVDDDTIQLFVDGEAVGRMTSEGVAHPTKRTLRLAVGKQAWVDDVRIYKRS